jgi:hypothetical protein
MGRFVNEASCPYLVRAPAYDEAFLRRMEYSMNKIAAIVLLLVLIGCVHSKESTPTAQQRMSTISIAEVTAKKVLIPDGARNIHTSTDTTIMDRTTIEYETEVSINHLMRLYQEDFTHTEWKKGGNVRPKGSPSGAIIFGIVGQDGFDLYFRNVSLSISPCAEATCVFIIDEGYGTQVDRGLN